MWTQIKILTRLELCNLFGWNVLRFSRDPKGRRKTAGMLAIGALVMGVAVCYVVGLTRGLIWMGLAETIPAYLFALSGLVTFFSGMLKAGSMVFRREGYDMLCALPLGRTAIAACRLLRLYVENLLLTVLVMLPGFAVYALELRPGPVVYLTALLGICSAPLLPAAASVLIGAAVSGAASRMRHKSLAAAGFSLLAVLIILYGSSRLSALERTPQSGALRELSEAVTTLLGRVYPPAVWMGEAIVRGSLWGGLLCFAFSLAAAGAVAAGVGRFFHEICRKLYSDSARHDYRLGRLRTDGLQISLCRREFARYFASSTYVINTIIGPIMGCLLAGAMLFGGKDALTGSLPVSLDVDSLLPFLLAGMFGLMNATAVSISMEGKTLWILKSLPLSAREIFDAKIGMNLLLILPFYLVSELMLVLALKPEGREFIWIFLIPAAVILFSCVWGITVNLRFPLLEWESEVRVVKQSAASLLGGMSGLVLAVAGIAGVSVVPDGCADYLKAGFCGAVLLGAVLLYRKNARFDTRGGL